MEAPAAYMNVLTFTVGSARYAIDYVHVLAVVRLTEVTPVPAKMSRTWLAEANSVLSRVSSVVAPISAEAEAYLSDFRYELVRIARRGQYFLIRAVCACLLAGVVLAMHWGWSQGYDNGRVPPGAMSAFAEHVLVVFLGLEFDAPGGKKKMDSLNHHTWKPVLIGAIRADGQFDLVWQTKGLVHPDSYSPFLHSPDELKKLTGAP